MYLFNWPERQKEVIIRRIAMSQIVLKTSPQVILSDKRSRITPLHVERGSTIRAQSLSSIGERL